MILRVKPKIHVFYMSAKKDFFFFIDAFLYLMYITYEPTNVGTHLCMYIKHNMHK